MFLKHGNSLLLNQEIKNKQQLKIKEPGLWEIQDGCLAFPGSLTDLILFDGLKPSLATVLMPSQ